MGIDFDVEIVVDQLFVLGAYQPLLESSYISVPYPVTLPSTGSGDGRSYWYRYSFFYSGKAQLSRFFLFFMLLFFTNLLLFKYFLFLYCVLQVARPSTVQVPRL